MTATFRFVPTAALAAFAMLCPIDTRAACVEGQLSVCTRNGCKGVRQCVRGQLLGCEVPGYCGIQQPPPIKDDIHVDLVVPGTEVGVLYDGFDALGGFNDRKEVSPAAGTTFTAWVSNISAPAFGNSVIAFAEGRQPRIEAVVWSTTADTVSIALDDSLGFSVTFWILAGDFATQQTRAAAAVVAVNNAYRLEKAGVRIAAVDFRNATANPAAATLTDSSPMQDLQTQIGFTAGAINVYVLGAVLGNPTTGINFNGTPVIVLGRDALTFPQVLEHEIGHAFVLWHTGAGGGFDYENVMWPTITGHYLTEGQIFRMHFHPSSQLNVFGLRPTQPVLICGEPMTDECPANNRRLWTDGSLLPN